MIHIFERWAPIGMLLLFLPAWAQAQPRPASIIDAVHEGHAVGHEQDGIDAVRSALGAGASVNERDENGWTPLMHAALECRAGIVAFLLDQRANVSIRAKTTRTSMFVDNGQQALAVAAGCFIARRRAEIAPSRGMPASYIESELSAAQKMVRDLIAHGADVNASDGDGRTPLMMAAMQGWPGAVAELLSNKAAVNARDNDGRLAIDYAEPKDREIATLLEKAGSQAPTGHSGRTICDAQRALDQRGYDTPIIDCIAGQQLSTAVAKFQKDNFLHPTGMLDPATRKALGIR
jgi:hypothetical protein